MNVELQNFKEAYLERSHEWFFNSFINLRSQIRQLSILFIITFIGAYIVFSVSNLKNKSIQLPYPLYFDNDTDYFLSINPIKEQLDNVNFGIAKYLLTSYLENLESFNSFILSPYSLEERLRFLYKISSLQVFKQYFHQLDVQSNSQSPLLLYRFGNYREVEVKNIDFLQTVGVPSKAIISYDVHQEINGEKSIEKKKKRVNFFMSGINEDFIKNKRKFFFLVINLEKYDG